MTIFFSFEQTVKKEKKNIGQADKTELQVKRARTKETWTCYRLHGNVAHGVRFRSILKVAHW